MTYTQRVYNKAAAEGMPSALAVLISGQANHETNGFTSLVFQTCRNCFGYKWVGQSTAAGPCSNSPEGDPYARYLSIEDSTREITQWIKRRQSQGLFPGDLRTITTALQYATLLKAAGYYGDSVSNYAGGIIRWLQSVEISPGTAAKAGGAFLVIAAALLYAFRGQIFGVGKNR